MTLHGQIMNLPSGQGTMSQSPDMAYKIGHRDARHAAAELALKADACVDALRVLNDQLHECARLGLTAAEAFDSFYQDMVSEALSEMDGLAPPSAGVEVGR